MSELAVEKVSLNKGDVTHSFSDYDFSDDPFADNFTIEAINSIALSHSEPIPFFMGGDRRSVLDEVVHLCQFSQHLVAVLGESGVGKTAFAYQAIVELHETARCCFLSSIVMVTVSDVLRQLVDQLGLFVSETATNEEILHVIEQYRPTGSYQRAILVVDDAHHLSTDVLVLLVHLLQHQTSGYLHVLLVGDSSLLLRLDELDKGDLLVYDIPLCPFTVDELECYLSFKLASVGYDGAELFNYDMLSVIWKETRGISASVNRVANKLLLSRSALSDEETRLGLPIGYMAVLVVLLAALIMAIFYVGDETQSSTPVDVVEESSSEPVNELNVALNDQGASEQKAEQNAAQEINQGATQEAAQKSEGDANAAQQVATLSSESFTSVPTEGGPEKVEESVGGEVDVPEQLDGQVAQEESVLSEEAVVDALRDKAIPQSSPSDTESISVNTNASRKLTVDEEAILFWPAEGYTLQVMAAGQLEGVKRFVSVQPNRRQLRIVTFERNGAPWYVVLVGVYESISDARQAIVGLPSVQAKAKPWARKVSDVQANIRNFGGR